jgi:hypothetical protein
MQNSLEAMEAALRVLTALTANKPANEGDMTELRKYAPDAPSLPQDELACEVIQRAIRFRAIGRQKA